MQNQQSELRDLLMIFEIVTAKGTKSDNTYEYEGITAWHDFDGYTCWLAYKDLTATLLFHGRFSFDYEQEDTFNAFLKKVAAMLSDKSRP
ncbi:DUF3081 family protein [Thalassotalea piscium]|uniref:Spore coat protein CotH n=1 Tax=Thalassotalea piscium TaxID=1230533 RepID=A0A7X0NI03_9GAMM|nr:DUF3081 family protein [Thalassotalea piscium]MBB6543775.1 spore coat protein CotH [Thalassotalea piscium]